MDLKKIDFKKILDTIKDKINGFIHTEERDLQFMLYIIIIIMINIASITLNFRVDLTRNNSYSLSDKSREVVSNLQENMKIKVLFSSKDLPAQYKSLYRYLIDILDEYNYYGNRYFSFTVVDEKDLEKTAGDFGIRPVQSREFADDQVKLRRTYMGLVIQQADLVEKIPAITGAAGLEYNITSLIMKMTGKIDGLLSLKEPIRLNLYMDGNLKDLPIDGIGKVEGMVSEAVKKCNIHNYDKIELHVIDASQEKEKSDLSGLYGIKKLKWGGGVTASGKRMAPGEGYIGIALLGKGRSTTIDLNVQPTLFGNYVITGLENLEDSINDAVSRLVSSNVKVGYITGHGEVDINDQQSREGGGLLKQLLSDMYEVRAIDLPNEDIPSDIGSIIINGPRKELTDLELYRIDQFLMKGKSAIVFLDSFQEIDMGAQQNMFQQQQPIVIPLNTGLEKLLKQYGITVNKDVVLDKNCAKVNMGNMIKDYPVVPVVKESGMNKKNVITEFLKGAAFIKVSSVTVDKEMMKKEKILSENLVSSSPESWLMTGNINFNPMYIENKDVGLGSYPLTVLVSGKFGSYFRDKDVPVDTAKGRQSSLLKTDRLDGTIRNGTTQIIVTGSSEITRSGFLMESKGILSGGAPGDNDTVFSNSLLLHNMVDYLAGNYFVPEMRSKSLDYNPLEKTGETEKFVLKIINIGGVPFLVVLAGILIWKLRSVRRRKIETEFSAEG